MTDHAQPVDVATSTGQDPTECSRLVAGATVAKVAQTAGQANPPPAPDVPWWLLGTAKRPFPRPLAYGFVRHRWFGPVRFSVRPEPAGSWLFQWHPHPDTRLDTRVDLRTLLDRRALADRLAARGSGIWADVIRDNADWLDWMLDVIAERGDWHE